MSRLPGETPTKPVTLEGSPSRLYQSDVCVWSLDGKPLARLLVDLDWEAAAAYVLLGQVGVLPREPDTFYSLHYDRFSDTSHCELRLQSLTRANLSQRIDLGVSE